MNCRNTVRIGIYSSEVSGIFLTEFIKENGEEVQKVSYCDDDYYCRKINDIIKSLKSEKVDLKDVTFLAPKKFKNTKLAKTGIKVMELDRGESNFSLPKFATIQGYKGLDSKIVILTDVDGVKENNYSKFIYIAATRARTLLYIVGSKEFWRKHK